MSEKITKLDRTVWLIASIFSIIGIVVSFILTIEKIELLKNPGFIPSCNLSVLFNCGSVMKSPQSNIFGVPNMVFGLIGYSVMALYSVLNFIGYRFSRRVNLIALLGSFGAFLFSYYLLTMSVFVIGTLCPYCLLSCFSATNIFFATKLYNVRLNYLGVKGKLLEMAHKFISQRWYIPVIIVWYAVVILVMYLKLRENY